MARGFLVFKVIEYEKFTKKIHLKSEITINKGIAILSTLVKLDFNYLLKSI